MRARTSWPRCAHNSCRCCTRVRPDELLDHDLVQEKMRALLKRYFRKEMGRRPMILPVIWEM